MGYLFIIFTKNTVSERERVFFFERNKMLPVTSKISLCNVNPNFKLFLCALNCQYQKRLSGPGRKLFV